MRGIKYENRNAYLPKYDIELINVGTSTKILRAKVIAWADASIYITVLKIAGRKYKVEIRKRTLKNAFKGGYSCYLAVTVMRFLLKTL